MKNTSRIHKKKYTSIIPHRMFVLGGVCTCACVCDRGGRSSLPPISIVLVYVLVVLAYMARAAPAVVHVHSLVLARCCSHPLGPVCSRLAYVSPCPATDAAALWPFLPLLLLPPHIRAPSHTCCCCCSCSYATAFPAAAVGASRKCALPHPPSMLVLLLLLQLQLCGCVSCRRRCRCVSRCHRCCIVSRCRCYHCAHVRPASR